MTIFMETTAIEADKTIAEIQSVLGRNGAAAILIDYHENEPSSISFKYLANGVQIPFRLPCRWEAILKVLNKKYPFRKHNMAQSKRVAWRQILRWVQAQLALVETNMVTMEEVFFPYIQQRNGRTIFEVAQKKGLLELEFKEPASS